MAKLLLLIATRGVILCPVMDQNLDRILKVEAPRMLWAHPTALASGCFIMLSARVQSDLR
jgi:hypothetical protein